MDYLERIQQTYQKMLSGNRLLAQEKLKEYYETFHNNFSPEKLKSLDGETLLNTMFNHGNRNSLVYWLEFKSDDEFPTNKFGGIGGGSAFKFGIYKRKEDGKWVTGSSRDIKEVSVEEAVAIVRQKRDLLIKGAEIIASIPDNYDNNTYIKLQEDLDNYLGNLGNTAWVHKYYHMLFPDKIDDFHAPYFQRFYLTRLLQKPIKKEGRYVLAGQYMQLAKQVNMHIHYFTAVLSEMFGSVHNYWRVVLEGNNSYWNEMLKEGYISVDFPDLGELNKLDSKDKKAKQQVKELLEKYYPNDPKIAQKSPNQLLIFLRKIKPDDIVVAVEGQAVLGIGRVIGPYEYKKELRYPYCLKIQWLTDEKNRLQDSSEGNGTTVSQYKDFENILAIERLLQNSETTKANQTVKLNVLSGIISQIEGVLQRKKQVILYGPPGTGKTYWAEKACLELASRKKFYKPYDQLDDSERSIITGDAHKPGLVRMCCFHPSYSYEDFIEGIKPSILNNQNVFKLKPGIFKILCEDALKDPENNYYMIIDEINRGDISRIFGELITIIEAGKRGKTMLLPLSGQVFCIPENVYIIGTMNTADRSIALLDVALRRRFGFIEMMPDYTLLAETTIEGLPLGLWLEELNRRIREHVGRDARNLQIGHSYFMENEQVIEEFDKFFKVIHEEIIPLLEEYCYGDYSSIAKIIGNGLVDVSNQLIRHDLFKPAKKVELISTLLETCPDITTSSILNPDEQETGDDLENDEE